MGVGKTVCLTVLLFDDLSVHPFVCSYTVVCMFLSFCLSTSSNFVCLSVRPSVCPGGGRVERRCWVNFQCRGVLLVWMIVGQGPIALSVGAGGGCLDIFSLIYIFSFLSPSLFFLPLFGRRPDID